MPIVITCFIPVRHLHNFPAVRKIISLVFSPCNPNSSIESANATSAVDEQRGVKPEWEGVLTFFFRNDGKEANDPKRC